MFSKLRHIIMHAATKNGHSFALKYRGDILESSEC